VAIYSVSTNINSNSNEKNTRTKQTKPLNQLMLFTFKRKFLRISIDLQSALAAEARLAGGQ
jgi:hypothetical protein